ncbi:aldo/keto reductase [Streptomyces sp. NBC_01613]|uniref:aldo/keto reductase n=1 Tax=Streptomyces sp. NBC_01613 TaxID=2975896 RepID=UPI003866566F
MTGDPCPSLVQQVGQPGEVVVAERGADGLDAGEVLDVRLVACREVVRPVAAQLSVLLLWVQDAPAQENAKRAFERSLDRLGLDYLDLYLMHQPYGDVYGQWRAMEDLHRAGHIKAIGVSNFYPDRLVDLVENSETTPAVNQVETHPFFQRADYQSLMSERGVQIESWGPLAEGRNNIFSDPTLSAIGEGHGKSVAQMALRWLVQRGVVVIPKSVRPERMAENLDVFDFELTDEEMSRIAAMDTGVSVAFDHRDPEWVTRIGGVRID